jgi:hypothetical protein
MESYWCLKKNLIAEMMKNPHTYTPLLYHTSRMHAIGEIMVSTSLSAMQEEGDESRRD